MREEVREKLGGVRKSKEKYGNVKNIYNVHLDEKKYSAAPLSE